MKILITSGGTTEKIDDVRGITNHSTGYLGKEIAELFLAKGHQVTLVTVKTAVKPEPKENLKITEITNVDSLLKSMEPTETNKNKRLKEIKKGSISLSFFIIIHMS